MYKAKRIIRTLTSCAMLLAAAGCAHAGDERKRGGFSAGLVLEAKASSKSVGLSIMPGAVRRDLPNDENNALTFALWGGDFGFQLAVLRLSSTQSPEQIAAYYQNEMSSYGTVLDCSQPAPRASSRSKRESTALECDDDKAKQGSKVFKVGKEKNFRLVQIEPTEQGANIELLRVVTTE